MDDGSIAWMIRGGQRAETREARLQRRQRLELAVARVTGPGWRDRLTIHRPAAIARPADPLCCAA
jgi:hypothetical protein